MDRRLGQLRSVFMSVSTVTYNSLCAMFLSMRFLFVQDLGVPDSSSYELTACKSEFAAFTIAMATVVTVVTVVEVVTVVYNAVAAAHTRCACRLLLSLSNAPPCCKISYQSLQGKVELKVNQILSECKLKIKYQIQILILIKSKLKRN